MHTENEYHRGEIFFINEGEMVEIDTRDGSYVNRVK